MSIDMRALNPATFTWLEELSENRQWVPIRSWMEPCDVAWLAARLEFVADQDDAFPGGKWATIQRLQGMVRDFARSEVNRGIQNAE